MVALPTKRISEMSARVSVAPHHSAPSPRRSIWCILIVSVAAAAIIFRFRSGNTGSLLTVLDSSTGTPNDSVASSTSPPAAAAVAVAERVHSTTQILKPERRFIAVSSEEGASQREIIFQYPEGKGCSGVLYLFHGCGRRAASFFYSPQGRDMMMMALNAGLAVVTFTKDNEVGCWSPGRDMPAILHVSKTFIEENLIKCFRGDDSSITSSNVVDFPFYGFGASSGGSFVAQVATETTTTSGTTASDHPSLAFQFSAINVQIMTTRSTEELTTPTIFTIMSRDPATEAGVAEASKELQSREVPTQTIRTDTKAVSPNYWMHRFSHDERMTRDIAFSICSDLKDLGVIADANGGPLVRNPRSIELAPVLDKYSHSPPLGVGIELWNILNEDEKKDAQALWLEEELNVAFDQHEITAERFDEVIGFFLGSTGTHGEIRDEAVLSNRI
mmetsp:Transcript_33850/g.74256  ORF Transcript_33850/g.74256 Transcript_33850/m.74256 type:complete len:445 (+) Transcript_33850:94-1428(+)